MSKGVDEWVRDVRSEDYKSLVYLASIIPGFITRYLYSTDLFSMLISEIRIHHPQYKRPTIFSPLCIGVERHHQLVTRVGIFHEGYSELSALKT